MHNTFISENSYLQFLFILSILWWQEKNAFMVKKVLCFTILPKNICSLLCGKHKNGKERLVLFKFPLHRHTTTCPCN